MMAPLWKSALVFSTLAILVIASPTPEKLDDDGLTIISKAELADISVEQFTETSANANEISTENDLDYDVTTEAIDAETIEERRQDSAEISNPSANDLRGLRRRSRVGRRRKNARAFGKLRSETKKKMMPNMVMPYQFRFNVQDQTEGVYHTRTEDQPKSGPLVGSYSYVRPDGVLMTVRYTAGAEGYKATVYETRPPAAFLRAKSDRESQSQNSNEPATSSNESNLLGSTGAESQEQEVRQPGNLIQDNQEDQDEIISSASSQEGTTPGKFGPNQIISQEFGTNNQNQDKTPNELNQQTEFLSPQGVANPQRGNNQLLTPLFSQNSPTDYQTGQNQFPIRTPLSQVQNQNPVRNQFVGNGLPQDPFAYRPINENSNAQRVLGKPLRSTNTPVFNRPQNNNQQFTIGQPIVNPNQNKRFEDDLSPIIQRPENQNVQFVGNPFQSSTNLKTPSQILRESFKQRRPSNTRFSNQGSRNPVETPFKQTSFQSSPVAIGQSVVPIQKPSQVLQQPTFSNEKPLVTFSHEKPFSTFSHEKPFVSSNLKPVSQLEQLALPFIGQQNDPFPTLQQQKPTAEFTQSQNERYSDEQNIQSQAGHQRPQFQVNNYFDRNIGDQTNYKPNIGQSVVPVKSIKENPLSENNPNTNFPFLEQSVNPQEVRTPVSKTPEESNLNKLVPPHRTSSEESDPLQHSSNSKTPSQENEDNSGLSQEQSLPTSSNDDQIDEFLSFVKQQKPVSKFSQPNFSNIPSVNYNEKGTITNDPNRQTDSVVGSKFNPAYDTTRINEDEKDFSQILQELQDKIENSKVPLSPSPVTNIKLIGSNKQPSPFKTPVIPAISETGQESTKNNFESPKDLPNSVLFRPIPVRNPQIKDTVQPGNQFTTQIKQSQFQNIRNPSLESQFYLPPNFGTIQNTGATKNKDGNIIYRVEKQPLIQSNEKSDQTNNINGNLDRPSVVPVLKQVKLSGSEEGTSDRNSYNAPEITVYPSISSDESVNEQKLNEKLPSGNQIQLKSQIEEINDGQIKPNRPGHNSNLPLNRPILAQVPANGISVVPPQQTAFIPSSIPGEFPITYQRIPGSEINGYVLTQNSVISQKNPSSSDETQNSQYPLFYDTIDDNGNLKTTFISDTNDMNNMPHTLPNVFVQGGVTNYKNVQHSVMKHTQNSQQVSFYPFSSVNPQVGGLPAIDIPLQNERQQLELDGQCTCGKPTPTPTPISLNDILPYLPPSIANFLQAVANNLRQRIEEANKKGISKHQIEEDTQLNDPKEENFNSSENRVTTVEDIVSEESSPLIFEFPENEMETSEPIAINDEIIAIEESDIIDLSAQSQDQIDESSIIEQSQETNDLSQIPIEIDSPDTLSDSDIVDDEPNFLEIDDNVKFLDANDVLLKPMQNPLIPSSDPFGALVPRPVPQIINLRPGLIRFSPQQLHQVPSIAISRPVIRHQPEFSSHQQTKGYDYEPPSKPFNFLGKR